MMSFPAPLLALLSVWLLGTGSRAQQDPAPTTVPIYLPYYDERSWSLVRGSVISKNDKETTYTIFCAPQTPPNCDIALEFPFVFAEGAQTLHFHGTLTDTYTAELMCNLGGTTAATCTGYSSLRDGYVNGLLTGPTESRWSKTLTGSDVQWGVLTLAEVPAPTDGADSSGAAHPTHSDPFQFPGTLSHGGVPVETAPSAGARVNTRWAVFGSLCSAIVASWVI